jgi:predicted SAM-dependent methyltransferase
MRLHIGGKQTKSGWKILNAQPGPGVDFVRQCSDLSIFLDESVEEIYASHVLEHLSYVDELPQALAEWRRVLHEGGKAMISVPDFGALCRLFLDPRSDQKDRFQIMRFVFGGQADAYDYHRVGLTYELLEDYLACAGFSRIEQATDFGLFDDLSALHYEGVRISLNVVAWR